MNIKNLLCYAFEVLSWASLIMLTIGLAFFVRDIWNDFEEGKTNDRFYSNRSNVFEHPTITICFEPQVKVAKLKKYNMTVTDLIGFYTSETQFPPMSPSAFSEEISYTIGKDFDIEIYLSNHAITNTYFSASLNETTRNDLIQVEELLLGSYGKCTILKISSEIKGLMQIDNLIYLTYKNQHEEKLPMMKIFFTSKSNAYGALWYQWLEGKVFDLTIKPEDMVYNSVSLSRQIRKNLPQTSHCSQEIGYYECLGQRMVDLSKMYNTKCFPVSLAGTLSHVRDEMTLCTNWAEENDAYDKIFVNNYYSGQIFSFCNSSCTQYQYEGQTSFYMEQISVPHEVRFSYVFPSNEIQIFEEYLMFGVNDLIGTIGGHSGLFIGFSFYGSVSTILQYVKNKL